MKRTSILTSLIGATSGVALLAMQACASGTPADTSGDGGDATTTTTSSAGATGGGGGAGGSAHGGGGSGGGTASGGHGGEASTCGNGTREPDENCDGNDFNGKTCQDYGLGTGSLICNQYCQIVLSSCVPAEACNDGLDNDQNGYTDCADPACTADVSCTDSCAAPEQIVGLPIYDSGDLTGRPSIEAASCSQASGPEVIYSFTPPNTTDVVVTLYGGADYSLSVRSVCNDAASETLCANAEPAWGQETVGFSAVGGQTYFLVVDGVNPGEFAWYELDVVEVLPESDCSNIKDDDSDGYVDCDDDTICKGGPNCLGGPTATGQPCFDQTTCASNATDPICLQPWMGFTDGYCSEFCDLAQPDCAGDAQCVDLGLSVNGVCLDGCVTNADCRAGYSCVSLGAPTKVCTTPPEANCLDHLDGDQNGFVDCEDLGCQASIFCVPGSTPAGQPCGLNMDCQASHNDPLCIDQAYYGWPGGYCSEFCNASDPCPAGTACVQWLFFNSGNGECLTRCNGPSDCRPGYSCLQVGADLVCVW